MSDTVRLELLTREDISKVAENALVILPIGAIEQHGPHLPICTDAHIVEEIAIRSSLEVKNEFPVYVAPVIPYGNSHHHFPFPALSLRSETLNQVLKDILYSLVISGFKNILILNSHGGNDEIIRIATRDLVREFKVSIAAASYWTISWDALVNECDVFSVGKVPGHAGGFETSLMLELLENHVVQGKFPPVREDLTPVNEMSRRIYIQRPNNTVGVDGYSDDARHASKERGKQYLTIIAREVALAYRDFMNSNNNI